MGTLRETSGSRFCHLQPEHLVGRGVQCALRLTCGSVSSQHALLRWQGQHWELIDRGSRNGTLLNGEKVSPGQAHPLAEGALITFGDHQETWRLTDARGPEAMVVALEDGEVFLGSVGVIGIPSAEAQATLYLDLDGSWKLETPDNDPACITDGAVFEAGGKLYRFSCPSSLGATAASQVALGKAALHFSVSSDEEFVQLRLEHAHSHVELGSRSQNYLLLLLARAYLADQSAGIPSESCGWVDKAQLATDLGTTEQQVDGEVHRVRRHFAQHGLPEAATVIERRARTRQLRIGIAELTIHAMRRPNVG
jgi:pSer/pThr/pTyr-binding forkhead associated (FHA) protein